MLALVLGWGRQEGFEGSQAACMPTTTCHTFLHKPNCLS